MRRLALTMAALLAGTGAAAQQLPSDIPARFVPADADFDFTRRTVDIPMRDGVKLHAVILSMKAAKDAPIILDRTPYGAEDETGKTVSAHGAMTVSPANAMLLRAGVHCRVRRRARQIRLRRLLCERTAAGWSAKRERSRSLDRCL